MIIVKALSTALTLRTCCLGGLCTGIMGLYTMLMTCIKRLDIAAMRLSVWLLVGLVVMVVAWLFVGLVVRVVVGVCSGLLCIAVGPNIKFFFKGYVCCDLASVVPTAPPAK